MTAYLSELSAEAGWRRAGRFARDGDASEPERPPAARRDEAALEPAT
jgi:hypothetical protein